MASWRGELLDVRCGPSSLWVTVHGCVSMLISMPPFPVPPDVDALIDFTLRVAGLGTALASRLPPEMTRSPGFLSRLDTLSADLTSS